jgi:CheY-like chemotaxis protein
VACFPLVKERYAKVLRAMMETRDGAGPVDIPPIVLVVEDDRDTRDMYEAVLNAEGFWVMKVGDAAEAFAYAKDFHPDAVLTDLGLPGESDGAGLIRELRAEREFQFTPIIAVTGRQPRELPSLRGLDISAVLLKPVSPATLIQRLRSALQHSAVLRARSTAILDRVPVLLQRSEAALRRSGEIAAARRKPQERGCPGCGEPLVWVESCDLRQGRYDYYQWCQQGCGLFCFNGSTQQFQQLAAADRSYWGDEAAPPED